jgi:hypothetical protein
MSRLRCECESAVCDHEKGCGRTPELEVITTSGTFQMCKVCEYCLPGEYKLLVIHTVKS